ncbi:MAG: THUMP domain-containing class I SAM-dependent RNA methyltransferase [Christensenellaceae bacterium]
MKHRCYASCAFGIEGVLAAELKRLELENIAAQDARVYFDADTEEIARANMFLRTADRVYLVLDEFEARSFEELYERVSAIPFSDILPSDARFPVNGNAVKSTLMSVSDIQSVGKKAIADALKKTYHAERFPENGNLFNIYINIYKDTATVALNTSGAGLNRRGYRLKNAQAPIKETLAAAMIQISRWTHRDFFDPMCGSGTIVIEAAMMAANMAPGIYRAFDAANYGNDFKAAFSLARQQAKDLLKTPQMDIFGFDIDEKNLALAKEHARTMQVGEWISFRRQDVRKFKQPEKPAVVITNPPYAKRIGEQKETDALYRAMGQALRPLEDTLVYVICANESFEKNYGRRADKKRKLYNGNIRCDYYQYFRRAGARGPVREEAAWDK